MNDYAADLLIGVLASPFIILVVVLFVAAGVNKVRRRD